MLASKTNSTGFDPRLTCIGISGTAHGEPVKVITLRHFGAVSTLAVAVPASLSPHAGRHVAAPSARTLLGQTTLPLVVNYSTAQ